MWTVLNGFILAKNRTNVRLDSPILLLNYPVKRKMGRQGSLDYLVKRTYSISRARLAKLNYIAEPID